MDTENNYTPAKEFQLTLEDTYLRLLVDAAWKTEEPQQTLLHSHISTELFVCGKGQITLKTEDGFLSLFPGDAAVIPPHVLHLKYQVEPQTEGYAISFLCERRSVRDSSDLYRQLHQFVSGTQIMLYRNAPHIFDSVHKIIREAGHTDRRMPVLHLAELLINMLDCPCSGAVESSRATIEQSQSADIQRMMELDKLIANAYRSDWNNRTIAELLYISPRQLDRIVLKRYGKTLHQVILDKRMENATQLLLTSDMNIHEIAVAVGFGSGSGLYRECKKRYGLTPTQYRERWANDNNAPTSKKDP